MDSGARCFLMLSVEFFVFDRKFQLTLKFEDMSSSKFMFFGKIQTPPQRPKNASGRVALPPGRFGSIRKIYGNGLLKTSLKK